MKHLKDLQVRAVDLLRPGYAVLRLTDKEVFPEMQPGQFVEIRVDGSPETFLRRPISINFVDRDTNELWLLVHAVGKGTEILTKMREGDKLNCLYPLGRGFSMPSEPHQRLLLIGGGVGTAPLLYFGKLLREAGHEPVFLLGGKTEGDILQREHFEKYGRLCCTTEDGSLDTKGFVTNHSVLQEDFHSIYTCGPKPMMKAVAAFAKQHNIYCEASLENMMACGLGACLCCVEKTVQGNRCVCTEGPVFDINNLDW